MAREDSVHLKAEQPADDLSPVKRALVEIRRLRAELEDLRCGYSEPVAIIGLAVRLPGGVTSPERFWEALAEDSAAKPLGCAGVLESRSRSARHHV